MSARARTIMIWIGCVGLALLFARGIWGLAPFGRYPGPYGDVINAAAPHERQVANAVTAVIFDYRGFDTLGEEFILFAAVAGLVLLLRGARGEAISAPPMQPPERTLQPRSAAVHWFSFGLIGALMLFGIYMVLHGHLSPGGGFQGGAIIGTATLLIYLGVDYAVYRRTVRKEVTETLESLGAAGYLVIGLGAMIAGGAFLQNFLPLGHRGDLLSGGTIPLINLAVGMEVAGGFALLGAEFLEETRAPKEDES